ncbi:putative alpha-ketoglutarate-dependent sulfonate dioxygenase [Lachnellula subtilissima]|uniref:Putative alpha-ketoglutarate-dependent sulfonate dioxygenase n=1 Tax=Lachnellula subtilissima TaxID=602034 RepID=A0A8H8S1A9_9HELO|nr:putative alpha-ketoglutarate-dependent sulfonate dioxygenase [Lachnellula subtilissima]
MAPSAIDPPAAILPSIKDTKQPVTYQLPIPEPTRRRLEAANVDLTNGYPYTPLQPLYVQDVEQIRNEPRDFIDAGTRADPEKKALFNAAKQIVHLTNHIGTEIIGLQLKDLTDKQKDELGLLIAERSVVFFGIRIFRPKIRGLWGSIMGRLRYILRDHMSLVFPEYPLSGQTCLQSRGKQISVTLAALECGTRQTFSSSDLVYERQPAGVTHLHNDTVPNLGGDTLWASGYAAYSKLSPDFRKLIDGKEAVFRSAGEYLDRNDPKAGPRPVERIHPIVRVHPATGWKSLFVNRVWTGKIVGLDKAESDVILNYLFDVYENNVDIQVRFKWTPGTSALWDNRITIHNASWDYEGTEERHGTRVTSLAEVPYFDEKAPTRREALGLDDN